MRITLDASGNAPELMSAYALVAEHHNVAEKMEQIQGWTYAIEAELLRRLEMDGATEIVTNTHKAAITRSVRYDHGILFGILELVPQADLIEAGAYKPAHRATVDVAAKWNLTSLKPFAKRGQAVKALLGRARKLGRVRLKVTQL
jgi:hypothetical protein